MFNYILSHFGHYLISACCNIPLVLVRWVTYDSLYCTPDQLKIIQKAYHIYLICPTLKPTFYLITLHEKSESNTTATTQTSLAAADGGVFGSRKVPPLQHCDASAGNPLPRKTTYVCTPHRYAHRKYTT